MKRTRRAALALMATSSSALAVETLGVTSETTERDSDVDLAGDENGYLGLTEHGLNAGGVLFEDGSRTAPAAFAVVNQLTEPISLTLESDRFWFKTFDRTVTDDGRRVVVDDDAGDALEPGERLGPITVWPTPRAIESAFGSTVSGTIEITADGSESRIDAERDLSLKLLGIVAKRAFLKLSRRPKGNGFEHRWLVEGVETTPHGLEKLRLDYRDVETAGAIDFTASERLSASIEVDGADRPCSIDRTRPHRLTVSLAEPVAIDEGELALRLTGTGRPASPGGGPGSPTGATIELLDAGFSTRLEARRMHPRRTER